MSAYDDLRVELDNTKHVNNITERERIVATVTARAVVDIAETLASMLAVVSAPLEADPDENVDGGPDRDPDDEPDPSVNLGPLDIGDEVKHKLAELDEPLGVITSLGESEGMAFAIVKSTDGDEVKVWLDDLERVAADPFDTPAQYSKAELEAMPTDAFSALKNRGK